MLQFKSKSIFYKGFSSKIAHVLKEFDIHHSVLDGCLDGAKPSASGNIITSENPHDNSILAKIKTATTQDYERCIQAMLANTSRVANTPWPTRGNCLKDLADELKKKREPIAELLTLEVGKTYGDSLGEVQESIDVCEYASGLSRKIPGQFLPSERRDHAIFEVWNPLGNVGIISAFNFPQSVFMWGFALSFLCGNQTIWKGSDATPLTTLATTNLIHNVLRRNDIPTTALTAVVGGPEIGKCISSDKRLPLVSFTGSTQIGKIVAAEVASRLGRSLLELGGNNAMIICEDSDVEQVLPAITISALSTNGQQCNSLRRLIIHESLYEKIKNRLIQAYSTIKIGDPLDKDTLIGPLITPQAVTTYKNGISKIKEQGGKILCGGEVISCPGNYVKPTLVEIDHKAQIVHHEIFAPILYLIKYKTVEEAIAINNEVPQGLASAMFTKNISNMMNWLGPSGSDCGIVNINVGCVAAEVSGAFGGEKETGGGRQSGSDSWKQFARRGTCVINYGKDIQLAQGISFDV